MKLVCVAVSFALFLVVSEPAWGQGSTALRDELRSDLADFRGGQFASVASPRFGQTDLRRDLSDFRPAANSAGGMQPNFQGFDPAQLRQRLDDLRSNFAPNQLGQNFYPSPFRDRDDRWRRDDDRWDGRHGDDDHGWHHDRDYDRDSRHAWNHDHDHDGWHRDGDRDRHDWRRDHDRWDWARHDDRWQRADGRRDNGWHTGWDPDHHKASWQDNGWRDRGFTTPPGQQRGGWEDRPRGSVTGSNFNDPRPLGGDKHDGPRPHSFGGKSKGR